MSTVIELDKLQFGLGAQNVHWEAEGAFTGEISTRMLTDLRCDYVIVGHSERREMFGETDETVNKKVKAVFEAGMVPIMCVGESLSVREAGEAESFCRDQVRAGLDGHHRRSGSPDRHRVRADLGDRDGPYPHA